MPTITLADNSNQLSLPRRKEDVLEDIFMFNRTERLMCFLQLKLKFAAAFLRKTDYLSPSA
jgi:hypothetical protein